jgi:hypothetical protein
MTNQPTLPPEGIVTSFAFLNLATSGYSLEEQRNIALSFIEEKGMSIEFTCFIQDLVGKEGS